MAKIYLLNNQKFEGIVNLEVFQVENIKFDIDLSKYNALVFTSKNAVYSINESAKDWIKIPSYMIAPKTAQEAENLGANIAFVGISGHGNDFAFELMPHLKDKKVLYVKAEKTVSNLPGILKENGIDLDEVVAYKTTCKKDIKKENLEDGSTIIFTSPSSVECFLATYDWNETFKAISIGRTTAMFLPKDISCEISDITSVEECVKLALKDFT